MTARVKSVAPAALREALDDVAHSAAVQAMVEEALAGIAALGPATLRPAEAMVYAALKHMGPAARAALRADLEGQS